MRPVLRSAPPLLFITVGLAAAVALSPTTRAGAQQPDETGQPDARRRFERLSQRATERLGALQAEADELAARQGTLLNEIRAIEVERQIKVEEVAAFERDLADLNDSLEAAQTRIADLEKQAAEQGPLVQARLVELYKLGPARYARFVLGAGDVTAMGRGYRVIGTIIRRDRERFEEHRRTLVELEEATATLEARQTEVAALREAAGAARRQLDRAIAAQTDLVAEIDGRRDLTAQLANELDEARQRFESALANLTTGSAADAPDVLLPLRPFRGAIEPPVPGEVTLRFGAERPSEVDTSLARSGVQFAAAPEDPVYAIHEGTVAFAGSFAGLGTLVIVDHGDQAFSLYGYLASLTVAEGVAVDQGTQLGTAGFSPAGVPAVYFELRIDGRPVDPLEWLKR